MQFRVVAYAELESRAVYEQAERHCSKLQSSSSKPEPTGVYVTESRVMLPCDTGDGRTTLSDGVVRAKNVRKSHLNGVLASQSCR